MRWKETDQESRKEELGRDIAWVAPVLLQDSFRTTLNCTIHAVPW